MPQVPKVMPPAVRNWCNIAIFVNAILLPIYVLVMIGTIRNGTLSPLELFLYVFFLGPLYLKYSFNNTMAYLANNAENLRRNFYTLNFEWLALITIWMMVAMAAASVLIALNMNDVMVYMKS